jgi:GT2 family glycosyltransferase
MDTIKVAAIIVTWNKIKDVCFLIEDTRKLNLPGISLAIFVVDNDSSDGTQIYLEENYPQIKVLQTGENIGGSGGFAYGMNFVSNLDYDYVWLLDNDVRLDAQSLLPLVETLQKYGEVGLVGSQIRKLEQPEIIQEIGSYIYSPKAHFKTNFANSHILSTAAILAGKSYLTVDVCAAASLLFRREIIDQIGVFENYFLHFDDVEWCLRAKQAGWVVAAHPGSIVWHSSPDFKYRPWISYYDERNLCYCWQKHYPNFLLKRLQLLIIKLVYYCLTGRWFWVEFYLQGLEDFSHGIKGKFLSQFFYQEYSLPEIIIPNSKVWLQSSISEKLCKSHSEINPWYLPKNIIYRCYIWLIAWFHKPVDVAIFSCYKPDFFYFHLARKVYFFNGTGYIELNWNLRKILLNIIEVFERILPIYWQIKNL